MTGLPRRVWHVSREYAGLAEAGGVKDVVRGLAEAHARAGAAVSVVLPRYGFLPGGIVHGEPVASFTLSMPDQDKGNALFEEQVRVHATWQEGVRLLFVDAPRFAAKRAVYTHTAADEQEDRWKKRGTGHWDFHQMNLVLQKAALETARAEGEAPEIVHCHDGHTAFLPALMREDRRFARFFAGCGAIVTIHNAGPGYHQEVWDIGFARLLTGLGEEVLRKGLLATGVDPLLLAGFYAPLLTVSPQYAREVMEEADGRAGGGLGPALRARGIRLEGVTNGVTPGPWDPRFPAKSGLPFRFDPSSGDLHGKRECRKALEARLGLDSPAGQGFPLYAFVGRLTSQKGIDVLCAALEKLLPARADQRFVVLGQGDKEMEAALAALAADPSTRGRLAFAAAYDAKLASLIYAASDFFLVPSAFEPCGLTDFIAQIMGSIPVVHRVGGLAKVRDGETGFSYEEHSATALAAAVDRTSGFFQQRPSLLEEIRRRAFTEIFSLHTWDRVLAEDYLPLYQRAASERREWTTR